MQIIDKLCSYNLPVFALKGNMYLYGKYNKFTQLLFKKYKNLNYTRVGSFKIKDNTIILFDIIFEGNNLSNKILGVNLKEEKEKFFSLFNNKNIILISHVPPFGTLDTLRNSRHVGSKILAEAIKKYQPKLVLCGHIHEAEGNAKIGKTKVYNLGSEKYKIIRF
ncbi:MAG: metallophosphoesterase [Candidatus Pacearchaeota archaeon]